MIFNTIMVQLDLEAPAAPRLKFGWELARRFEADMIAFAAAQANLIVPMGDSGIAAAEVMRHQVEEIGAKLKSLEKEFQTVTNDDPRASWRGQMGDPTGLLALNARAADLVVVGGGDSAPSHYRGTVSPGELILSAGRPILVAADSLSAIRPEAIVVAWKDTREARRAVVDAMPFLTQAQHVLVVAVDDIDPKAAGESVGDVVRFLMKHGVKARSEVVDVGGSQATDALAQLAFESGANLVVAGGYGHSRLREWAFGGVTRSLLAETSLHRLFSN
jgi:nucleotide-binding universal stress UspA family protein